MATIEIGTKIYYKGDMVNRDGFGFVAALRSPSQYDITLDDGRQMNGVHQGNIGGSIRNKSCRFMTRESYDVECAAIIECYRMAAKTPTQPEACPTCHSPSPRQHPAVQHEGEVQLCRDPWHKPTADEIEGELAREQRS